MFCLYTSIFTKGEGDAIESSLPLKIFSTLTGIKNTYGDRELKKL